jgi:uncharacterized protein (TIGR03000 family)
MRELALGLSLACLILFAFGAPVQAAASPNGNVVGDNARWLGDDGWYQPAWSRRPLPLSYSYVNHTYYVTDTVADSVVQYPVSVPSALAYQPPAAASSDAARPQSSDRVLVRRRRYVPMQYTDTVADDVITSTVMVPIDEWVYEERGPATTGVVTAQSFYRGPGNTQCMLRVLVPSETAKVFIEDQATQQQGTDRLFVSPPLETGSNYTYTVKAKWMENGKEKSRDKTVKVSAGDSATVDFVDRPPEKVPAPNPSNGTATPSGKK